MSGDPQQLLDAKRTLNDVVQIFGAFGTYHPERFLEVVRGGIGELLEVSIRCGESIIGGAQGVGVTLARRHIPRNLRSSNDSALRIQQQGNGQRDRQNPSVFVFRLVLGGSSAPPGAARIEMWLPIASSGA
jgi:hypothetical protein